MSRMIAIRKKITHKIKTNHNSIYTWWKIKFPLMPSPTITAQHRAIFYFRFVGRQNQWICRTVQSWDLYSVNRSESGFQNHLSKELQQEPSPVQNLLISLFIYYCILWYDASHKVWCGIQNRRCCFVLSSILPDFDSYTPVSSSAIRTLCSPHAFDGWI